MSFTSIVKDEVTRLEGNKFEYMAEMSCIFRNNARIDNDIIIMLENNSVARRVFKLVRQAYDVTPIITVRRRYNFNNHLSYLLRISNKKRFILEDLAIVSHGEYLNVPHDYIINDEECLRAYLRGLILTVR